MGKRVLKIIGNLYIEEFIGFKNREYCQMAGL